MLQDVGAPTWITSLIVLLACAWVGLVDVRRWQQQRPVRVGIKRLVFWAGAVLIVIWAINQFSKASDAPHNSTTGVVQPVQRTFYHGDGEGMIACVQDCKTLLLNFTPEAAEATRDIVPGTPLKIGYLDRSTEVYPNVFGFEVVDVWDAAGVQSLYHYDTSFHRLRLVLLGLDAVALIVAGIVCSRLSGAEPDPEEEDDSDPDLPVAPAPQYRRRERPSLTFPAGREGAEPAD